MIERLIEFSLNNRLLVVTLSVLGMGAGYYSYQALPVDAFPDVSPNLVQVFTATEGLAPEEIEQYVTYPVEAAMNGLPRIVNVRSVSNFGLSVVNVYFEDGMDIYLARQLVNERLQEAREQIPDGFGEPAMGPISTGMGLILFYYLDDTTGRYSLIDLREMQDWIVKFNLQTTPGVTEVLGIGGWEKQFHVVLNPDALLRYDLSVVEVIDAIKSNNLNVGAQFIERNDEEYVVRSVGLVTSAEELGDIVVRTIDGTPVHVHDVAEVKVGGAVRRGAQTANGVGEVVAGLVIKLFGTNSSTVIAATEAKLEEINQALPEGVVLRPYYDQKSLVEACVATVTDAIVEGVVLVSIVVLLFLGTLRPSIVVALTIPFSVLFSFVLMRYFGMSANLMSLGGLAIAIGMLLDGAIVVVENVHRMLHHADSGTDRTETIRRACVEVGRPVSFAVLIIIVVFLPLFTLQGVEGKTFRPLAYTVAFAMGGSLLYAVLVAPVMSDLLLRPPSGRRAGVAPKETVVIRSLLVMYRPLLRFFVRYRAAALALGGGLIAVGIGVYPRLGSEFTPSLQEGTIVVRLTMAPSISLERAKDIALIAERRLMKTPEVGGVVSRIGRGEVGAHADPVNSAEMYVLLKPKEAWRSAQSQEDVEGVLRAALHDLPGVAVNFTQPIAMSVDELLEGVRAELAIKLFGPDLDTLKAKADEIARVVRKVRGAADVQTDQVSGTPQLLVQIDRSAIARYGINVEDIQSVIQAAVGGAHAGQIFEGVKRFDILARYAPEHRATAAAIRNILVTTPGGARLPLSQLARIEEITGPRQITRENNQRFITVQCNVVDRDIGSFVAEAQRAIESVVELPAGYLIKWGGQFELQQQANRRLMVVVPITLALVFLLLYATFGSLRNAFLILLNVPLALVGGIVALWVSGQNLSVPSSVGFIALFGVALLNGTVLVTYLNQLTREGVPMDEACVKGACLRFRPVLMTATCTSLGLVPLLFSSGTGSEVQRPLATVVVGGLITSTVLTLLVIPALYKWFAPSNA